MCFVFYLVYSILNKFDTKVIWKRLPSHLNFLSTLPCKTQSHFWWKFQWWNIIKSTNFYLFTLIIVKRCMSFHARNGARQSVIDEASEQWQPKHVGLLFCTRCRIGVVGNRSSHFGNKDFGRFRLLWPWPWPDDLHARTWPVLPGAIPDTRIYKYELLTSMLL